MLTMDVNVLRNT